MGEALTQRVVAELVERLRKANRPSVGRASAAVTGLNSAPRKRSAFSLQRESNTLGSVADLARAHRRSSLQTGR